MMEKGKAVLRVAALLMTVACVAGCASGPAVKERFFWPRPPEQPRIEWLSVYASSLDVKGKSVLKELVASEAPLFLGQPMSVAADGAGRVFVADQTRGLVVFDLTAKDAYVLGDDQPERPENPTGLTVDREGNLYVGDSKGKKVFVYDRRLQLTKVLDLGKHGLVTIGYPAVDADRKRLVIPDIKGQRVVVVDMDGALVTSIGTKGGADGEFLYPSAVALDKEGNILVCDQMNARVQRFSPDGKFLDKFGTRGDGPGEFAVIKGVALDSEGHVYVTDGKNHKVGIFDLKGRFLMDLGSSYSVSGKLVMPGGFNAPQGIFIDKNDTIYVADSMNRRIQTFQYLNDAYLKLHPLTEGVPAEEKVREEKARKK
jgi:sugar lactone lactonase YvrE